MPPEAEDLTRLLSRGEHLTERRSLVEARLVLEDAVRLAEQVHGPDSLETRGALGLLERAIGLAWLHDPAIFPLVERQYRISLGAFGPSDRRMHHPTEHYAGALELVGRSEEALRYYARAVELAEPLEEGDIVLLFSYARALGEARRTPEALRVVDRMRELEALAEPRASSLSEQAVAAIAHFADAAAGATVLKSIDET